MNYYIKNRELYHHGIKGQRWGRRRFQNADGTLTDAGKKRYSESVDDARSAMDNAKQKKSAARKAYSKAYQKHDLNPSEKNKKDLMEALSKYRSAKSDYKQSKIDYKVAKKEEDGWFDDKPKSKHRTALEEKYKKQGYTDKQAAVLADGRIRTEKVVAATAAVTVAACAAYMIHKHVKDRTDQTIKSGDLLQRIEMQDTGGKLNETFYASKGNHDNKRYEGVLGMTRKVQTGEAYLMKLKATDDIKVASKDKAAKVFGELYKNDPEFRNSVSDSVSVHILGGKNKVNVDNLSDRNIKKMYDNFNAALVEINRTEPEATNKFYGMLKSAGYGAIQDINDMKYSGYKAKNPLIVFDNSKNRIVVESVKALTDEKDMTKKAIVEAGKMSMENMRDTLLSPYMALATSGTAAGMYAYDYATSPKKKSKS